MSITLTHTGKGRQVTVPEAVADSYISQGWVAAGSPAPAEQESATTETKAEKPSKKWNKDQIAAYAKDHEIELTDAKTKDDMLALIVAAELAKETGAGDGGEQEEESGAGSDDAESGSVPADADGGAEDQG